MKQLEEKCRNLTVENEALKAAKEALQVEVEMYRNETGGAAISSTVIDGDSSDAACMDQHFVQSGDGTYPSQLAVSIARLHDISNCLTCRYVHIMVALFYGLVHHNSLPNI